MASMLPRPRPRHLAVARQSECGFGTGYRAGQVAWPIKRLLRRTKLATGLA